MNRGGSIARNARLAIALLTFVLGACDGMAPHPASPPSLVTLAPSASNVFTEPPVPSPSGLTASTHPVTTSDLAGHIAFADGDGVWIAEATGENRRQLTHGGEFDPALSPDGKTVLFRRMSAADDGEIWTMNSDGTAERDVSDNAGADWGASWSPDGRAIVFSSVRNDGAPMQVWTIAADGSNPHQLTQEHGEYPSFSPDGRQIAFASSRQGNYDIYVMNADGTDQRDITNDSAYQMSPAWSPDGTQIAFDSQQDFSSVAETGIGPEFEIHLVKPDGSSDVRITDNRREDRFPSWSPDGRFLMWSSEGRLTVAWADGTGQLDLGSGSFPSWSN
jgi:TolB protein